MFCLEEVNGRESTGGGANRLTHIYFEKKASVNWCVSVCVCGSNIHSQQSQLNWQSLGGDAYKVKRVARRKYCSVSYITIDTLLWYCVGRSCTGVGLAAVKTSQHHG